MTNVRNKMTSSFNWDDFSINTENPEEFFGKRHIKHERVYYDLMSAAREMPKKIIHKKENNKENIFKPDVAIKDFNINKLTKKCENKLKISVQSGSNQQNENSNSEITKCNKMLPPVRLKAYDYAEIYKKRKEAKAIEAAQKVLPPPIFKSKPLPTFYRSTKMATNVKSNRMTVPITPMVLKRSANNKKIIETSK